jgi:carboxylate-amine ligase
MHQSVVEVGTNICKNVHEAEKEIKFELLNPLELAAKQDLINGWRLPA